MTQAQTHLDQRIQREISGAEKILTEFVEDFPRRAAAMFERADTPMIAAAKLEAAKRIQFIFQAREGSDHDTIWSSIKQEGNACISKVGVNVSTSTSYNAMNAARAKVWYEILNPESKMDLGWSVKTYLSIPIF